MAAFADIILNDGQTTPIAHTFKTKTSTGREAVWEDRAGGVPVGFNVLKAVTKDTDSVRRVVFSFDLPILETVSGANPSGFTPAPKVAYYERVNLEFISSQRSATQNRKDMYAFIQNALANATFKAIVVDGDEIAG